MAHRCLATRLATRSKRFLECEFGLPNRLVGTYVYLLFDPNVDIDDIIETIEHWDEHLMDEWLKEYIQDFKNCKNGGFKSKEAQKGMAKVHKLETKMKAFKESLSASVVDLADREHSCEVRTIR